MWDALARIFRGSERSEARGSIIAPSLYMTPGDRTDRDGSVRMTDSQGTNNAIGGRNFGQRSARSRDQDDDARPNAETEISRSTDPAAEALFQAVIRRGLNQSQSIGERAKNASAIGPEILRCSEGALDTLWEEISDLTSASASLEAREVGFFLLKQSSYPLKLLSRRIKLFELIITSVDPSLVCLQISALNRLSNKGRSIQSFDHGIVLYLNRILHELFPAVEHAREVKYGADVGRAERDEETTGRYVARKRLSVKETQTKNAKGSSKDRPNEEKALLDVFYMIADVITHNASAFHDAQLEILLTSVTMIARKTTSHAHLRGAIRIISGVAEHSHIPSENLEHCVHALCAVIGSSKLKFGEEAWIGLQHLLRSEHRELIHKELMKLLKVYPNESEIHEISKLRGALLSLRRMAKDDISFLGLGICGLIDCLRDAYEKMPPLINEILALVAALLSNPNIASCLRSLEWDFLHERMQNVVRTQPVQSDIEDHGNVRSNIDPKSPIYDYVMNEQDASGGVSENFNQDIDRIVKAILHLLEGPWKNLEADRKMIILNLFLQMGKYTPIAWQPVVTMMWDHGLLSPYDYSWRAHVGFLTTVVLTDQSKSETARCAVLKIFVQMYPLLQDYSQHEVHYLHYLRHACKRLRVEDKLPSGMIIALADLSAQHGAEFNSKTFDILIETIIETSNLLSPDTAPSAKLLQPIVDCLIILFLRCLPKDGEKSIKLYKMLLSAAASPRSPGVKLSVMKLIARLRCDADFAVKAVLFPDNQDLASVLGRTKVTASSIEAMQPDSNRTSTTNQAQLTRTGRSSAVGSSKGARSRSATRSINAKHRKIKATTPLGMYGGANKGPPEDPPSMASPHVFVSNEDTGHLEYLVDFGPWLDFMIGVLANGDDWDIYSYIIVHLPSQLSNCSLFENNFRQLQTLHDILNSQLSENSFCDPPVDSGIKRGDIALCLYNSLTMLLGYQSCWGIRDNRRTILTFRLGIEKWDRAGKCCIHALAICCHEIPKCIEKDIGKVVEMMQKRITQSDLAMDILEFLGGLARLKDAYGSADATLCQRVFGICIRYLQHARDQRKKSGGDPSARFSMQYSRMSSNSGDTIRTSDLAHEVKTQSDAAEYVYTLAYQVIIFWFLAIDVHDRAQHVGWITQELAWKNEQGREEMEEQSLVILDMMHRTTFSDLGETLSAQEFLDPTQKKSTATWLVGMSIVTAETLLEGRANKHGQFTKRQASGTTYATYFHNTADLPAHHVPAPTPITNAHAQHPFSVYPNHIFISLVSTIAPVPVPLQPIPLPENDEHLKRALRVFDSHDTVDGHKAAVIFVGEGQSLEAEILGNTEGTDAYEAFLAGLGTKVALKDAKFNTQGLDRQSDSDGMHTYAWRDRVTEIVYHVPTMMPSYSKTKYQEITGSEYETTGVEESAGNAPGQMPGHMNDSGRRPAIIAKKSHVGNDHVKIIYNNSEKKFAFDTFSSAYNSINIVITPEAQMTRSKLRVSKSYNKNPSDTDRFGYYHVQVVCSPSYPQLSPAASPKIISADALPAFVRQLALNASVFCQVWEHRSQGEHISSWRARLQQIMRLRERFANTNTSANVNYPMSSAKASRGNRTYVEGDLWSGDVVYGGLAETSKLSNSLDFTRWTK